ncbi:MAG: sigma 54-interacting transcriptional regulator [Rhodanobacter sp.]|nr:sigma 54-interacting transcriptional regulator [Rhodanobacter sp.]
MPAVSARNDLLASLRSLVRFESASGHIWLDQHRMMLLHTGALGALRRELLESLGEERARGLLLRMGFVSGQRDAQLARKLRPNLIDQVESFSTGPLLHALEGVAKVSAVKLDIDIQRGRFYGEYLWQNSWECESHVRESGYSDDPQCWSQIGYASGYTSAFMNRFIVYKEVECTAQGDPYCRIVGKPAEEWHDPDYLQYFRPDSIAHELLDLQMEVEHLRSSIARPRYEGPLVGASSKFLDAMTLLRSAAPSQISVLLLGETGVGKEVFAHWLHDNGPRADKPFVAVNCGAIPDNLIEAELFGVEKGAYTDAQSSRAGRFERADGGTLFLDEVGDLPPSAQVKLLRALQSGEIERLGGEKVKVTNVRVVAATNVDLLNAIQEGRFRADLYYRLATLPITIPPLRERRVDIPLLAERFIEKFSRPVGKQTRGLSDRAMQSLVDYAWPGNIRELENVIERGVLLTPDNAAIDEHHLFPHAASASAQHLQASGTIGAAAPRHADALTERVLESGIGLEELEDGLLQMAVERSGGNLTRAAKLLGISRAKLAYRIKCMRSADKGDAN